MFIVSYPPVTFVSRYFLVLTGSSYSYKSETLERVYSVHKYNVAYSQQ